ncbi:hypothetical protein DPMN_177311 [Dreissena polymorpha]|uniref:Uncharacterized protein n=2 Tax=Dreissena polymorpha TaxID=45954 RepID=A0A9D4EBX3_DREPO|nr:hypothetical protein DPMN_177311 [Dreissena polymorpha]
MRSFAIVLLCIVVAAFGQEGPPDTLTDDEGNVFRVKVDRESMQLLNSTGSLVSTVLNSKGWVVVISSDKRECIISDASVCPGLCFELVPFPNSVPAEVLAFCIGLPIMQQVPVPCPEDTVTTAAPVVTGSEDDAALKSSGQLLPVWPAWPKWSCCCRWRRIGWWPCLKPVCLAYNTLGICVNWGCAQWHWHWHWIQDCVCGYEWPFFYHHG